MSHNVSMRSGQMSIGELADAAGLTRRAIRFYVQQRLLPAPLGLGRGRHYDQTHLDALRRIAELQQTGHSLEQIRRLLRHPETPHKPNGQPAAHALRPARTARARPMLSAELWTRLKLIEGVELHFDAARHQPLIEHLSAIRQLVREAFRPIDPDTTSEQEGDDHADDDRTR